MNTQSTPFQDPSASTLSAAWGACASNAGWPGAASSSSSSPLAASQSPAKRPPWAARTLQRLLQQLGHGRLAVHWPNGQCAHYGPGSEREPTVEVRLHDWGVCAAVLKSGDIGFGEAYLAGQWDTPDLAALLRLLLRNRAVIERLIHGHWAGRLLHRVRHWLNRNTRANSRKNIQAHYDLGNDFYRLWLDAGMNYSSAWFQGQPSGNLEAAQRAKLRRALHMAGLQPDRPGQRVLEIGCGWGALAEQAAHEFGAHVTGITLSDEQLAYAQQRLQAQGLAQRADLRLQDYRDLRLGTDEAPFDAICSIEMVEAVGRAYWPTYFDTVARLLKRGGRACIQSIVIRDELYGAYVSSTDFIQQHVFPGGCLPSAAEFRRQAAAAGLRVVDELAFGPDYAETCRRWHRAFLAQRDTVRAQGFDGRFERLWTFYLAYCEAGFDEGDIDVIQFTLEHAP